MHEAGFRTVVDLDTTNETGGIHNIPFIVKHANATSMKSTFWIHELNDGTLRLQYLQVVMLDFSQGGTPGLIGWPHVGINMLTKSSGDPGTYAELGACD